MHKRATPTDLAYSFGEFGPFLRYLRRRAHLTQRDLGVAVGYSIGQISLLESGKRLPDLATLAALFVPALELQDEPELVTRLLQLAAAARGTSDRVTVIHSVQPEIIGESLTPQSRASVPTPNRLTDQVTRLPAPVLPLIGRESELDAARSMLLNPAVRLLTLVGPPGVGKTRLALQLAWETYGAFAHGAHFIELASLTDPALVEAAVAQALGLDPNSSLVDHLRNQHMLLVLDNFEQVLLAASFVADLLVAAPTLKVLVTSRAALRVYGEHEFPVPPLAVPDLSHLPSPAEIAQYPSVALFVGRARAVKPDFALTKATALPVGAICVQLDGLPLAIELAAAQSKLLAPSELAARLVNRLATLTRGARNLPARHQTLRGAIDWSNNLLEPDEQKLFARLGVFVGGFDAEAAERVAHGSLVTANVLNLLYQLLDKSLLKQSHVDGELRFTMLETIREYAVEQLVASGEEDEVRQRHAQYYLALAEMAAPHLSREGGLLWRRRLERELDNLRSALRWSLTDARERSVALRLANALGAFWYLQGLFNEGRAWLEAVLSQADGPAEWRAQALAHLGILLGALGDYQEAMKRFDESLALFRAHDSRASIAWIDTQMAHVALLQGDYARAIQLASQSLELFRAVADHWQIADALTQLGTAAVEQGHYAHAAALLEECLHICRTLNNVHGIAKTSNLLGMAELERGQSARSLALFEESLGLYQQLDDKRNIAWTQRNLGLAKLAVGAVDEASSHLADGLSLYHELNCVDGVATILEGLGAVAAAQRQPKRGARLLGAAAVIREAVGMPISPNSQAIYQRMLEVAQAQLKPDEWESELARGRAMDLAQAVAYARAALPTPVARR